MKVLPFIKHPCDKYNSDSLRKTFLTLLQYNSYKVVILQLKNKRQKYVLSVMFILKPPLVQIIHSDLLQHAWPYIYNMHHCLSSLLL